MRLLSQYPSAVLQVLVAIGLLIAYLVARGRRLGFGDLFFFAIMAVLVDWLAFAMYRSLHRGSDPGDLIVLIALLFAVPIGAWFTLGAGVIALRMVYIALTGGRDG